MPTNNVLVTKDYDFTPQNPAGALSAATPATVTLSPVPLGVNGADTNHYLRIVGAPGASESVLITGGTAVSGGASGTIQFTPANSHNSGYSLSSATAGIQEAVIEAVAGNGVYVPPGTHMAEATITVPARTIAFFGEGIYSSRIRRNFASGDLLRFSQTTDGVINIHGLDLASSVTCTSGAQLYLDGFTYGSVRDVYMNAGGNTLYDGILTDTPNGVVFSNITIRQVTNIGLGVTCARTVAVGLFDNITVSATGSAKCISLVANGLGNGYGFVGPVFSNIITQGGAYGMYFDPAGAYINEGRVSNLITDSHTSFAIYMGGSSGGSGGWAFDNVLCGVPTGQSIYINSLWNGVQFSNVNAGSGYSVNAPNVVLAGCKNIKFSNSTLAGCGNTTAANNIAVKFEADGSAVCNHIQFNGCMVGWDQNGAASVNFARWAFYASNNAHTYLSIQNCNIYGFTDGLSLGLAGGGTCLLSDNWTYNTTQPTASAIFRRSTWYTEGGASTADKYEVCSKDAGGTYAWRTLI